MNLPSVHASKTSKNDWISYVRSEASPQSCIFRQKFATLFRDLIHLQQAVRRDSEVRTLANRLEQTSPTPQSPFPPQLELELDAIKRKILENETKCRQIVGANEKIARFDDQLKAFLKVRFASFPSQRME